MMIIGNFWDFAILYEIMEDYSGPPFVEGLFCYCINEDYVPNKAKLMTLNAIRNHLFDTIPILTQVEENEYLLKLSKEDIYKYGIDNYFGRINSINKDIIQLSVFNIYDYCWVFLCIGKEKERLVYTLDESIENPEIYDLFLEKGTVLAVLEEFINSSVETLKYPMQAP